MEKEAITLSPKEEKVSVLSMLGSVFILCMALFVLFWGVFGFWSYLYPSDKAYVLKPTVINAPEQIHLTESDGFYFASLPTQHIQLTESLKPLRTLNIQLSLVLKDSADYKTVAARLPLLQDALISDLKNITLDELAQNERLFIIKETLLDHFNTLLSPVQVQDVLIQKIIVKENE